MEAKIKLSGIEALITSQVIVETKNTLWDGKNSDELINQVAEITWDIAFKAGEAKARREAVIAMNHMVNKVAKREQAGREKGSGGGSKRPN